MTEHDESHGHSVAAWTAVAIILVATAVMSAAVVWPNTALFIGGAALVVLGAIAGKVLSMAGYGDKKKPHGRVEQSSGIN